MDWFVAPVIEEDVVKLIMSERRQIRPPPFNGNRTGSNLDYCYSVDARKSLKVLHRNCFLHNTMLSLATTRNHSENITIPCISSRCAGRVLQLGDCSMMHVERLLKCSTYNLGFFRWVISVIFCWDILVTDISVVCLTVVLKFAITVFIRLHFQKFWPKWSFFRSLKKLVYDRKKTAYNWQKRECHVWRF